MQRLIETTKNIIQKGAQLPFSVYTSVEEQNIFNVPVNRPLLIFVLSGCKKLGKRNKVTCPAGNFIFLSNNPNIDMRNIPDDEEYFAILIEFDYTDFDCLESKKMKAEKYFQGPINAVLENTLKQFIEWSDFAPSDLWASRRQEILQLLLYSGFEQVRAIMESPTLSHKLYAIISSNIGSNLDAATLSSKLAMSESTLRRKLNAEGTSLQTIKDRAKLGHGLHLVQTSLDPIGLIAEQCGYQSQSRFTDKFKQLFGITPTDLRKTRMPD